MKEFLKSLSPKLQAKALHDIELLEEFGEALREPHVKAIKGSKYKGIYELRIKFASDIARVFYFIYYENHYVLLHGFLKKSLRTPKEELERAKNYRDDYIRRMQDE